jgi:hypothetical protein
MCNPAVLWGMSARPLRAKPCGILVHARLPAFFGASKTCGILGHARSSAFHRIANSAANWGMSGRQVGVNSTNVKNLRHIAVCSDGRHQRTRYLRHIAVCPADCSLAPHSPTAVPDKTYPGKEAGGEVRPPSCNVTIDRRPYPRYTSYACPGRRTIAHLRSAAIASGHGRPRLRVEDARSAQLCERFR